MIYEHEIDYSAKFITIGEIKARIAELVKFGRNEEPDDDSQDDQEVWGQWEEFKVLQDVESELAWCWDDDNKTLIHTDKFDDYTREYMIDIGAIQKDTFLIDLIDWDKAADNILQDYKRVNLPNGNDFWTRA